MHAVTVCAITSVVWLNDSASASFMLHTAHRKGLKGSVMSDEKSKVSFLYHAAAICRPPLYQLSVILSLSDLGPVTPHQFLRLPRAKHRLCLCVMYVWPWWSSLWTLDHFQNPWVGSKICFLHSKVTHCSQYWCVAQTGCRCDLTLAKL